MGIFFKSFFFFFNCGSRSHYSHLICSNEVDGLKSPLLEKCFSDLNLYEAEKSSGLIVQLKLKCLLMKQTHDDIIEANEVKIQQSFERYKGKLMLHISSPSV